ncbi:MAG TPA: N-acetylneuraminate synthase family protein [Gaiellaceae bacterium]|nr:N-acetylneuraminate synthase family protein [Gaiellaceae bacterium]
MQGTFTLGARTVGRPAPCLVIGEVGLVHDGSLGLAHALLDAIADAGADAVKFQTHIAAAESTPAEPFRVQFSAQDATRYAYWERTAFDEAGWHTLAAHAAERGILFLSSPFSNEAVELLQRVGVPGWKIGSGELANPQLLDRVAATGLPVLLSSGMSPLSELDRAVERLRGNAPVAILQCTSAYPTRPDQVGLNLIAEFEQRYGCPVGLSDHSGTIYPALAAVVLGASIVEVHVTLSERMFGPDVIASVDVEDLRRLVEGIRFLEQALASPVDKDAVASTMQPLRELFTKSVVARGDLPAGTVLAPEHLALRKPGTGLAPERLHELVGRRLRHGVDANAQLTEADLE